MCKTKALVLFSGGLDSVLAIRILQEQGINVTAVCFRSCFFNENKAKKAAKELNIKLKVKDISKKHLVMVKNPKYGYGKNMNPCIDCHLMMVCEAGKMMKYSFFTWLSFWPFLVGKKKYDFIATGEVLGQRPMSQNKNMLELIDKKSGTQGYILRPLSAKLLKITEVEKQGLVDRNKLLDISGRSRKRQIELSKKFNIKNWENASGGCLLTDSMFSQRLKEILEKSLECDKNNIELLKIGRHFWQNKVKIVVGRDEKENKILEKLKIKKDVIMEMKNYPGPTTLVRNYGNKKISKNVLDKAKELTQHYSTKARDKDDVKFRIN